MADKILPNQGKLTKRPVTLQSLMDQKEAAHVEKNESLGSLMGQAAAPKSEKSKHINSLMGQ
jgi:hypothetical protein